MKNKIHSVLSLLVLLSMVLAACAPAATATEAPGAQTQEPAVTEAPTEAPAATPAPTEAPTTTRTGAWVDQVIFTKQDSAEAAVSQLNAGDIDIYAYTVAEAPVYESLKSSPNLTSSQLVGSNNSMMFNPARFASGKFNPFVDAQFSEAMNYLVDGNYVVQAF